MVCRLYGWTWDEFVNLPQSVFEILIERLADEARERERNSGF